ncbi:MAG: DivIVA domain-containing protein, partial [Anaerovorax sp.]
MKQFRLNIDGKEVLGLPGQTILEVAKENDIFIPTLCFDERTEIYGACGICVVEVEGNPKMVKACATEISPNMVVMTNTHRVMESRKTNLELLLSNHVGDCRPPCALACPAQTDCQGYVGLIANGQFKEAIELIKGLQEENDVLQNKLGVLATNLEKYREDEDSLRSALIGAQKLGDSILKDSRSKAEVILRDATTKADHIVEEAHTRLRQETQEYERVKTEVTNFRENLISMYKTHIDQ